MNATQTARPNFVTITETAGNGASREQMSILYTRYAFAAKFANGVDVLEVACGAGVGFGLLAGKARRVVGGDIDDTNCATAAQTYRDRPSIMVQQFDALRLPFRDASFGLVILFEAIYYLPDAAAFFKEARRVLAPGGTLVISSVNCEWSGFNPSPFHTRYYSASELAALLQANGFSADISVLFPDRADTALRRAVSLIKRMAVRMRLIPDTMKGKELLKRLFYGPLSPIPRELAPGIASCAPLTPLAEASGLCNYKMIYAVGRNTAGTP